MRFAKGLGLAVILGALPVPAAAEEAFDACEVFTPKDAQGALGATVVETSAFKGKRPRVVMNCQYAGMKDGRAVAASAQFRVARTEPEMRQAFADSRLELQTKPMFIGSNEAFWSARTGQLYVRKGRAQVVVSVGPEKQGERDIEATRKLAEILVGKM